MADEVFLSPSLRPCIQPVGAARAHSDQVPRAPAHIFVRQFGIWCTHTGGTPVLREAHMTQFTKMFAVSGLAMATVIGLSWVVASPAPTNASTYVAAQIDPDQMTRNAPRDLPSFDQTYQRHLGVLDVLPH